MTYYEGINQEAASATRVYITRGGGGSTTTYIMAGRDTSCAPGAAPHVWSVVGTPDPTGASAGALPCGGPLSPIWIMAIKTS